MVATLIQFTPIIARIPIQNLPIINVSIVMTCASLPDPGFNHVTRARLNGQAIINNSVAKLQDYVSVRTIKKSLSNRTYVLKFATILYT